jgi:hypothetical protein
LKQRSLVLAQVAFRNGQKAENEFAGVVTPWNITFSSSCSKLIFSEFSYSPPVLAEAAFTSRYTVSTPLQNVVDLLFSDTTPCLLALP